MHRLTGILGICVLASCGSSSGAKDGQAAATGQPAATNAAASQEQATSQIAEVIASYDSAVVAGDTARAVSLLHPELVVYEHGHVEGSRDEFVKGHLPADMDFMRNATMTRRDRAVLVSSGADMAYSIAPYELSGEYEGKKVHNAGTETLVLVRTDAGWKIRHAHYSGHKIEAGK
jgi:ketosteroid isomerase-like protein